MPSGRFRMLLGLAIACLTTTTEAQIPDSESPTNTVSWRLVLEQQLKAEKTCDLLEVLMFDEFKRGGETVLEGKVSCIDGRMFDFSRRQIHQKFELSLCEPIAC